MEWCGRVFARLLVAHAIKDAEGDLHVDHVVLRDEDPDLGRARLAALGRPPRLVLHRRCRLQLPARRHPAPTHPFVYYLRWLGLGFRATLTTALTHGIYRIWEP